MSKLEKSLVEWIEQGIIDVSQADRIRLYESQKPEGGWSISGPLILGVVIIGVGIISLIAANWRFIPDTLKLISAFLILASLAIAAFRTHVQRDSLKFDALIIFFALMCLATIGLISQVFHTGGKLEHAFLFWCGITFGVIFTARRGFLPFLWIVALTLSLAAVSFDFLVDLRKINDALRYVDGLHIVAMTIPLLSLTLTTGSRFIVGESPTTRAFQQWTILCVVGSLVSAQILFHSTRNNSYFLKAYLPAYILFLLAIFIIYNNKGYKSIQKHLYTIALIFYFLVFHAGFVGINHALGIAILNILAFMAIAFSFASIKERKYFQYFLVIVGIEFVYIYLQAFGGLASTGLGLVLSGALLVWMTILWKRNKNEIALRIERWLE